MRPRKFSYTLSALDADGFCVDVTGTIQTTPWTTIAGSPADGLAHQTTLASTADLSGIDITVNGTDAEGREQSETIAGPNNNTVNLIKYFKTVTSVSASGTLGENTMLVGWTGACQTKTYVLERFDGAGASVGCYVGGTISYVIQNTNDNVFVTPTPVWYDLIESQTSHFYGTCEPYSTATRVKVASHTSGTLDFTVGQSA